MPRVKFVKEKKEIEVPKGTNLRAAMIQNGIQVYGGKFEEYMNCRGHGLCGTCTVFVKEGDDNAGDERGLLPSLVRFGRKFLGVYAIGHEDEARLSCQTTVEGDMTVEATPSFNYYGDEVKYTTRPCE